MTRIAALLRSAPLLTMTFAFCIPAPAMYAQQTQTPSIPSVTPTPLGADSDGSSNSNRDPEQVRMLREMSKTRNVQRQKEIIADTDHLLDLVKQLKDAVDKSNKDELSLSVVNTAGEIEKLAKSVKEKMRDGQ